MQDIYNKFWYGIEFGKLIYNNKFHPQFVKLSRLKSVKYVKMKWDLLTLGISWGYFIFKLYQ